MSVCAKFQLSSWSRSGWKVWGGVGGRVGCKVIFMFNPTVVLRLCCVVVGTKTAHSPINSVLQTPSVIMNILHYTWSALSSALQQYDIWCCKRKPWHCLLCILFVDTNHLYLNKLWPCAFCFLGWYIFLSQLNFRGHLYFKGCLYLGGCLYFCGNNYF